MMFGTDRRDCSYIIELILNYNSMVTKQQRGY